jgi:hypothetical protein
MARREADTRGGDFGSMLHEDHSAPANLPQGVIQHECGMAVRDKDYYYDDTMRSLDRESDEYERKLRHMMHEED